MTKRASKVSEVCCLIVDPKSILDRRMLHGLSYRSLFETGCPPTGASL